MVAKINRGTSLFGALIYNQDKVDAKTGCVIFSNRMMTNTHNDPQKTMQQTLLSFENYLLANKKTENPVLHISLNPSPEDQLSDEQFGQLAKDYMEKMGYGDQPYIVYKHEDINRHHIHIVSVCVNERGEKISDSFQWRRSMDACRELEQKYDLKKVANKRDEMDSPYLKKVDYFRGDVKTQIANVLKTVGTPYKYQSFGEYSAMLSCFNIEAKMVKGEFDNKPYNGVVYHATDDNGNTQGTPFKSSLFGKSFGHDALERRMKRTAIDFKSGKLSPKFKSDVMRTRHVATSKEDFVERMKTFGVNTVFRENDQGRIYGVTFIDHNNKEVYNGSRLGKEFSANVFNNLFNELRNDVEKSLPELSLGEDLSTTYSGQKESSIEEAFGAFGFEQHGTDSDEEAFARRTKKRKKKQRRI